MACWAFFSNLGTKWATSEVQQNISYIWNCNENVEKLRNETQKLKNMKGNVETLIDVATNKGEGLLHGVQDWMKEVNALIGDAETFLEEEAKASTTCVDLFNLHYYGKKAAVDASLILLKQSDGKAYESRVSSPTDAPRFLDLYQKKDLAGINTQMSALKQIIESIEDERKQIIGIYGTGGVGKTTLAKEVAAKMKAQFAEIVFVVVSQNVDATKIGKQVETAAKRIMKGEKILIILDDVWSKLKLDELGIPCGNDHMNCTILLTSRKRNVCAQMNAQSEICVSSLMADEAWILFKHVIGEGVETDARLKEVAMKVVEGCGGLPLIIKAVGTSLKDKNIRTWKTALAQLNKHAPLDIDPEISLAFTHLQLSYDYLNSEEAKSCFLLCGMFPEDANIPLERLTYYAMSLEILKDPESMEDARNKVQLAVNILNSSSLLLDGETELTTKMHDTVREVALLIASKGNIKYLVEAGKDLRTWNPRDKTVKSCTGISLIQNNISKLPDYELQIPLLDVFLVQENCNLSAISDEFTQGVKNARVLDMENNNLVSLPQSLKLLTRLRMLNLGGNKSLHDVSILGELKDVEILVLNRTGIKEIPQEIGQLIKLRRLEVKHCCELSYIAPGVIAELRWLEELYIGFYSQDVGNCNSLVEIGRLTELTYLDLFVKSLYFLPQGIDFEGLKGFLVQVGGSEEINKSAQVVHKKSLILTGLSLDSSELMQVKKLIEASDGIVLDTIPDLNNTMPTLYSEGFDDLKSIMVSQCDNLTCLVDSTDEDQMLHSNLEHLIMSGLKELNVIWNSPDQYISLEKLVRFEISDCDKLVKLFPVNVAQGLVSLQKLVIIRCGSLQEVIWDVDEEPADDVEIEMDAQDPKIVFPSLVHISLSKLKNLTSFYPRNATIKYPSLVKVDIYDCDRMVKWGYGTHDTPSLKYVNYVKEPSSIDDGLVRYRKYPSWIKRVYYTNEELNYTQDIMFRNRVSQIVGFKI